MFDDSWSKWDGSFSLSSTKSFMTGIKSEFSSRSPLSRRSKFPSSLMCFSVASKHRVWVGEAPFIIELVDFLKGIKILYKIIISGDAENFIIDFSLRIAFSEATIFVVTGNAAIH